MLFFTRVHHLPSFSVQKIELQKMASDAGEAVRGHVVVSLISRDRSTASPRLAAEIETNPLPTLDDPSELPEGLDEKYDFDFKLLLIALALIES